MAVAGGGEVPRSWEEELASLVEDSGIRFAAAEGDVGMPGRAEGFTAFNGFREAAPVPEESLKDQMKGFAKASAELMHELGRSCWEIGRQSVQGMEESYVVKRLRGPMAVVAERLRFLNEYLPEDRDPAHAWPVVIVVFLLAAAVLSVNSDRQVPVHLPKKVYVHPPSAARIHLPDGRCLAYREQGVSSDRARFSMIAPHSFLSSRLAGIPGIKDSLLEEFGVRLISYDLPGFGESDPHHIRDLNSSALDVLYLANASGVAEKFWVVGYSGGAKHAWAAVRYIPDSIAGALMLAPMGNPYDIGLNKEEKHKTWAKWTTRKKFMYILARKFPYCLRYFYRRSFLSGTHGHPEKLLSVLLGKKDKILLEDRVFKEFWERDMEESIRQGDTRPFIEETVLQVSNWGFSLSDIQVLRRPIPKGFLSWLKSFYSQEELEWAGFLGPIHVWQGMDDQVVPPAMSDFVRRVVPGTTVHKLHGEGHFSYFYFCDECHRHILSTIFGTPRGPVEPHVVNVVPTDGIDRQEETCPEITSQD